MTIQPMSTQGPFIPFEKPVPVPDHDAMEDPHVSICFNADWLPVVLGALKVLARPETWEGIKSDIEAVTKSAHDLLGQVPDDCLTGTLDCNPVYIGTNTGWMDYFNTPTYGWVPQDCLGCGESGRVNNFVVQLDVLGNIASNALVFQDANTGLPSGIQICQIEGYQSDSTLGNVWNFTWEDCLGNTHQEQQIGNHFVKTDIDVRRYGLSALAPFSYSIVTVGPILCTEA